MDQKQNTWDLNTDVPSSDSNAVPHGRPPAPGLRRTSAGGQRPGSRATGLWGSSSRGSPLSGMDETTPPLTGDTTPEFTCDIENISI